MQGTSLSGRGVKRGRWTASPSDKDHIRIRMECDVNAGWWATLILSSTQLIDMLAALDDPDIDDPDIDDTDDAC